MTMPSMTTTVIPRAFRLALCLAATPALVAAQIARDTARVAPVVVTATRSALATRRSPSSVSVVTGEQLKREGITTVVDALRRMPGLTVVQSGSFGGVTSLFIRGGESKFTKVLIDGIAVNDAGGSFDFSTLSTDNIDRIEVVRGPASVLYGSEAMAGVVQLITRSGAERRRVELSGRGGGYGSFDADLSARGSEGALDYSAAGARHSSDGIHPFNSRVRQDVGSGSVGVRGTAGDARLSVRFTENEFHFPTNGAGEVVDSNSQRRDDRIAIGLDAGYAVTSHATLRVALASHDVHGVSENQPDSPGDKSGYYYTTGDRTRRRSGDVRLDLDVLSVSRLSVGGQVEREWQASETQSNFGASGFTARRRTTGLYGQWLIAPVDRYTFALGGRYEHNEQFGDFFTYRAAGSADVAPRTRVRASIGTAFREPTFLENFGGAGVIGNAALVPERARSIDVGVEQGIGRRATVSATYFANSFRDLIDYKYSATAPNYFNLARTRTTGAELEGRVSLPAGLYADASFTYLDARVVDPGVSSAATAPFAPGARLLRRPMHTFDAGLGYHAAGTTVDVRAHRVGAREDNYYPSDFSSTQHVRLAPYTRADLSGEAPLMARAGSAIALTLRMENVFDARYTDVAGVNHDFAKTDAGALARTGYRGAGRRALLGVRARL